jgi:hypothetical protein
MLLGVDVMAEPKKPDEAVPVEIEDEHTDPVVPVRDGSNGKSDEAWEGETPPEPRYRPRILNKGHLVSAMVVSGPLAPATWTHLGSAAILPEQHII